MGSDSQFVAPHLVPARTFDAACVLVVEYLARVAPMGMWAVTRIVDGRQIFLTVEPPTIRWWRAPNSRTRRRCAGRWWPA